MDKKPVKARKGISSIEMIVAMASGATLMAGLSGILVLSSRSLDIAIAPPSKLAIVGTPLGRLRDDLRQAVSVETDDNVLRVIVPDRDGDGTDETIAYRLGSESGSNSLYRADTPILSDIKHVTLRSTGTSEGSGSDSGNGGSAFTGGASTPQIEIVSNVGGYGNVLQTTLPDYSQPGDVYLIGIAIDTNRGNLFPATGWTTVQEKKANNGTGNGSNNGNGNRNGGGGGTPQCQAGLYRYTVQSAGPSIHQFTWNHGSYAICWVMRVTGTNSSQPITFSDSKGGSFVGGSVPPQVVSLAVSHPNSLAIQFVVSEENALQKYRSGLPAYTDYLFGEQPTLNATVSVRNLRDFTGTIDTDSRMLLVNSTDWVNIGAVICSPY